MRLSFWISDGDLGWELGIEIWDEEEGLVFGIGVWDGDVEWRFSIGIWDVKFNLIRTVICYGNSSRNSLWRFLMKI